jgi:NAD(P)-dependent dehydrogenase (short-subunit alcohol dehydrogenase family)
MLKGKVAIVTGAAKGIGLGIAELFAKNRANVVVSDIDMGCCKKEAARIAKKYKVRTLSIECDVSKKSDVDGMMAAVAKRFKKIDILVNNAGIYPFTEFMKLKEEEWDKVLNIDLKSIYLCSQSAAKYMKKGGNIINLTSIAGLIGFPSLAHYCAAKSGMIGLTKVIAIELGKKKIRVNAIAPGIIDTPGTKAVNKKTMLAHVPLARTGKPIDIAQGALYLASDMSDYVTGHTLVIDGGWTTS